MRYYVKILLAILVISLLFIMPNCNCNEGGNGNGNGDETIIQNVQVLYIKHNSVTVTWLTSPASTSQVEYGLDATYGSTTDLDTDPTVLHNVELKGLEPSTTYHFRVKSSAEGKNYVSDDQTFTTTAVP